MLMFYDIFLKTSQPDIIDCKVNKLTILDYFMSNGNDQNKAVSGVHNITIYSGRQVSKM